MLFRPNPCLFTYIYSFVQCLPARGQIPLRPWVWSLNLLLFWRSFRSQGDCGYLVRHIGCLVHPNTTSPKRFYVVRRTSRMSRKDRKVAKFPGWWFGTFFTFPYIGNNHPNWLSYFSDRLTPPTSFRGHNCHVTNSAGPFFELLQSCCCSSEAPVAWHGKPTWGFLSLRIKEKPCFFVCKAPRQYGTSFYCNAYTPITIPLKSH